VWRTRGIDGNAKALFTTGAAEIGRVKEDGAGTIEFGNECVNGTTLSYVEGSGRRREVM